MLTENVVAPAVSANEFAQKRAMGARPLYVARCVACRKETELYVHGRPLCLDCDAKAQAEVIPGHLVL
jgi:hypothetical protein